jgi:hypothetical protein
LWDFLRQANHPHALCALFLEAILQEILRNLRTNLGF